MTVESIRMVVAGRVARYRAGEQCRRRAAQEDACSKEGNYACSACKKRGPLHADRSQNETCGNESMLDKQGRDLEREKKKQLNK